MDAKALQAATSTIGTGEVIDRAIKQAVRERLLEHKARGESIVVWRDGKVTWLTADEIDLPPWPEPAPDESASSPAAG